MDREARALIFGEDAPTYDDARPGYPPTAVAHVESLVDARDAVEVGAGTGKATESFARADLRITCLEPSQEMADVLVAKSLPGVDVVICTFEDWDGTTASVDLIYAAQAWHWVDRSTAYVKTLSVLRPGGVLALLWNIPLDRYARHEEVYRRFAPHLLEERDERIRRRDSHDWCEDMDAAGFVDTQRFSHRWSVEVPADRYRSLYASYSDHMMLNEPDRTRLLDALAADVETWGGHATVDYRTEVFSGKKPDTARR